MFVLVVLLIVTPACMASNPVDPLTLVCKETCPSSAPQSLINSFFINNSNLVECSVVENSTYTPCSASALPMECCHSSNKTLNFTVECNALSDSPQNSSGPRMELYYNIVIAFLALTNVLLIVCVILCGVALRYVRLRALKLLHARNNDHTLEREAVKVLSNPTYEQCSLTCDQQPLDVGLREVSANYSTLGPTYDSVNMSKFRVAIEDDKLKKKGKIKQRHTEPVRGPQTRDLLSVDSCGYSRLFQS